jgi:hypothetical protein
MWILAVDRHKPLIQVPLPACTRPYSISPSVADLNGQHRAKSVPPKPDRLMADVDASLMQQIFDIANRKWESDVQHHCQADDLKARLKYRNGLCFVIRQR